MLNYRLPAGSAGKGDARAPKSGRPRGLRPASAGAIVETAMVRIERTDDGSPFEMRDKRFYLPFRIVTDCPLCGFSEIRHDLDGDHYLAYPVVGAAFGLELYCPKCEDEFIVSIRLDIVVTPVVASETSEVKASPDES